MEVGRNAGIFICAISADTGKILGIEFISNVDRSATLFHSAEISVSRVMKMQVQAWTLKVH
jgi:hypothetical protein